jgi:hypothetical protein
MLARIVALETALLAAIALEHRRIQIQGGTERRPLELSKDELSQHRRQMFDLAAHQPAQVARQRHRRGHPRQPQDRLHHFVHAQSCDMGKAPAAG